MPVPVVIKKLACWRPPMPLQPPAPLRPPPQACPYQQPPQHASHVSQYYQLYPIQQYQPYPYPYPANVTQQMQHHLQQMQQQQQQQYAIAAPNESIPPQNIQTQLVPPQNDSDSHYRQPPPYPLIEYSSDIVVLPGNIVIQTTDAVPDGYLLCDGSDVSRETEAVLFAAIGTFYGDGDGSATFCLPDLEDEDRPSHHYMIKR
jgi:hypothetical protein